jgi:hypothetical protein
VLSEIVSSRVRSKANSLFISINFFCNALIGLFTLTVIVHLGGGDGDTDK